MYELASPIVLSGVTAITPYRRETDCTLLLLDGKIAQMSQRKESTLPFHVDEYYLPDCYVLPGFIDVHIHGGRGHDFADDSFEGYDEISRYHASHGTTSILATIYPQPPDHFLANIRRLRDYCESRGPERIVEGIHIEGPFLNPEMHGAIRPEYMWPASAAAFYQILEEGGGWIRVMSIAPEIPGAIEVLRSAAIEKTTASSTNMGNPQALHLSIGHSNACYEKIAEAIDNGLGGVTHIFNAMPSMHHRRPGVLAGTLLRDELFVEVIADAVHVHPAILQLLLKVKKPDKILLVSDAIRAAGQPDGSYDFSGQSVIVRDGRAYLAASSDTLAGSTLTMDRALRMMVKEAGASLEQAAQMASLNAARILEWKYRRGILAVGKDADLVVMNQDLQVQLTIKAGHIVWKNDKIQSNHS